MIEEITALVGLMRSLNFDEIRDFLRQHPGLINQEYNVYQLGTYLTIEGHPAGGWTPIGYAAAVLRNMDLVNVLLEFNPDLTHEIHPFDGTDRIPDGVNVRDLILELQLEGSNRVVNQTIINPDVAHSEGAVTIVVALNASDNTIGSFDAISEEGLLDLLGRELIGHEKDFMS